MNRPYISLAVTAVALAFAAAQFNAASATPQIRSTASLRPNAAILKVDLPCAAGFKTSATSFPGKGHNYPCTQTSRFYVKCKKGYYLGGQPHVVKSGSGWVVRYYCQSPPH